MAIENHTKGPWAADERGFISAKVCLDARYDQHGQQPTLVLFVPASTGGYLLLRKLKKMLAA